MTAWGTAQSGVGTHRRSCSLVRANLLPPALRPEVAGKPHFDSQCPPWMKGENTHSGPWQPQAQALGPILSRVQTQSGSGALVKGMWTEVGGSCFPHPEGAV